MNQKPGCVFCSIVAKQAPATVRYEDDQIIVIDNLLKWVPVMLIVMPKNHITQMELWSDGLMTKMGNVAVDMGAKFCPKGFRFLSNFGADAMQSQEHGHLHVIGGVYLGPYA
jgi:histidine triad (HIT) family protein